jgi:large subunit ribosomal protein L6
MSKIGKKQLTIPEGVTVAVSGDTLTVKGKNATLTVALLKHITPKIEGNTISFETSATDKQARANWGTFGALVANALVGVQSGFEKKLEIQGIGFKAAMEGANLSVNVGFTHPVKFITPKGVKIAVEKNQIIITGADKYLVGQTAAQIRKIRKPEPYQGKGIRYVGEQVRRKEGKKVAGATA